MKQLDLRVWNIISPYDLEDSNPKLKKLTPTTRSKSAKNKSRPKTPVLIRKSLPKPIGAFSHLLTPTESTLKKIVKRPPALTKSKSTADLKPVPRIKPEKKSSFKDFYKQYESLEETPAPNKGVLKNLKIDTDQIEKEYFSPIQIKPVHVVLDTLDYCTPFTVKEAISDLLTGKIYSSIKVIREEQLRVKQHLILRPRKKQSEPIEIIFPEERQNLNPWKVFKHNLLHLVQQNSKALLKSLLKSLKRYEKPSKKVKKPLRRNTRSLQDVSIKIGELIAAALNKPENSLQALLEKVDEVRPIHFSCPPQYHQSQDFIVDLLLLAWNSSIKPLTAHKISLFTETDRLISDLQKHKDPTIRLQRLLTLIPLLIITNRLSDAAEYTQKALAMSANSKIASLWMAWLEILTTKNTAALFYALSESSPPANLSIQYRLALVYTYFYSCVVMGYSRTLAYIKTLDLGEWEGVVLADFYIASADKASEEEGIGLLKSNFESSGNVFVKFLAFFRLFKVYKAYYQHTRALELVKLAEKMNFPENLKVLVDICKLKVHARLNTELIINSEVPLIKYQYSRLSLKYSLRSPLHRVLKCINDSCAYAQIYCLHSCQFSVNFWKFILYHKLKVQKLAVKQAQQTLEFESGDRIKHLAINESLKNLNSLQLLIEGLPGLLAKKDHLNLLKTSEAIEKFDSFLAICIKTIITKTFQNKEEIPIHKFEGHFAIWSILYRNSKQKEKQFKSLEGQEEIDKRDKSHPLHVLSKIKRDWEEIIWMHQNSVSLPVNTLWGLFGKGIGSLSLKGTYRIMQSMSYKRTSILRGIHKLQKAEKSSINSYYQAKFSISVIKFQKSASEANFQKVFGMLKEFVWTEDISKEYQIKVLYLSAELAFMTKDYQLALKLLSEAEEYSGIIGSNYLAKPKRALNIDLVRSRLSY